MADYNVRFERAKFNFLNGDLEGYSDEFVQYLSSIDNYFTNNFIDFLLDNSKYGRLFCDAAKLESKGIIEALKVVDETEVRKLLQALIMFNVDVQSIIKKIPVEEKKKKINNIIIDLAYTVDIPTEKLYKAFSKDDFKFFFKEHENIFDDKTILVILNDKADILLSERVIKILLNDASLDACMYYYHQGKIDISIVERKKEIIAEKEKIEQRNMRIKGLKAKNPSDYTEDEIKVLIEDLSADQFYDMFKKGNIGEELVKKRQIFDYNLIQNARLYDEKTVAEAITGTYFQKSVFNLCLDLRTITEYCKSKKIDSEETKKITHLYNFLSGSIRFENSDEYEIYVNDIVNFLNTFSTLRIGELINQFTLDFGNELEIKLSESKEKIFSKENLVEIEGVNVPTYRIQNLTENQKNFFLLIHSSSFENAKNYFMKEYPGISLSVLDDSHLYVFGSKGFSRIVFGYDNLENGSIISVNTRDGQTNQRNIFDNENNSVMAKQLYNLEDFMKRTLKDSYNEIALKFSNTRIKPSYIISFSETPLPEEIEIANMFEIPILIIEKQKYAQFNQTADDEEIENESAWYEKTYGRIIKKKKYQEQVLDGKIRK